MDTRVRKLRIEAEPGLKASEFARKYDLTEATFRSYDNGIRPITRAAAKQYAKLFSKLLKRPIDWLYLLGEQSQEAIRPAQSTIMGWAGAGDAIHPFETDPPVGRSPAPPGLISPVSVIIHGTSMFPVYRNDDEVFFDLEDERRSSFPFGEDCLVLTASGQRLLKNIRKSRRKDHVRLFSYETNSESDDVQIQWAAPVRWVRRGAG